jgi:gentisate 1,2-dioxygenase
VDGESHEWEAGDLIVVDHWAWHQHFNDDKQETARLIRVHNFDALYDMMRILLDPLNLFEELPELDAPDLSGVVWPDHFAGRPAS